MTCVLRVHSLSTMCDVQHVRSRRTLFCTRTPTCGSIMTQTVQKRDHCLHGSIQLTLLTQGYQFIQVRVLLSFLCMPEVLNHTMADFLTTSLLLEATVTMNRDTFNIESPFLFSRDGATYHIRRIFAVSLRGSPTSPSTPRSPWSTERNFNNWRLVDTTGSIF